MTKTVEFDVAQAADDVVIMHNHKPVAKLVATSVVSPPRVPGLMKGKLTIIAEDNEHLDGFEEYMP